MSDRFDQLDRTIHRMHFSPVDLDATGTPTVGAITFGALVGRDFADAARLNQAAQTLAHFVGRDFNFVIVGRPRTLLHRLNLAGYICGLLENFSKFFFECYLFRVHAILLEIWPNEHTTPSLTQKLQNLPLTFSANQ
jgi:hypothetical protein